MKLKAFNFIQTALFILGKRKNIKFNIEILCKLRYNKKCVFILNKI